MKNKKGIEKRVEEIETIGCRISNLEMTILTLKRYIKIEEKVYYEMVKKLGEDYKLK